MEAFKWSSLNRLQLGRYAEYLVMMEFTRLACSVFSSEVDDRGIDFVIRTQRRQYYEIQVKSSRDMNYVFLPKSKVQMAENFLVALVLFLRDQENPDLYLIPMTAWSQDSRLFANREYPGKTSDPEYGLNLSARNLKLLEPFRFSEQVEKLLHQL